MLSKNYEQFILAFDAAIGSSAAPSILYEARLLLPGEDAAVIVTRQNIIAEINDVPVSLDHSMNAFVEEHECEIREVAAADLGFYQEIVMAGRWHNHGTDMQEFEPYLTRKTDDEGRGYTDKYDYEFFGYGGEGHNLEFNSKTDGWTACRTIMAVTARLTDYCSLSPDLPKTLGLSTGAIWYPPAGSRLPYLVMEHANEQMELMCA
ncbi:hypothetical protein IMCC20628_03087 [Hoeflea sp. IMCC20628]|uniref:hypothetical protein n=1 Tax=Hoeflea sp. IMCC20628 TaxID=1620421 RepID=UPI00063AB7EC|nr:hypothetical protein [Hoeflea sp. IMCC20628]AKI01780.1 hypothetical protein IMCC20628_03087 [Hoeflea sp. IMCC20628]